MRSPENRAAFIAAAKRVIETRRGNPYTGFYGGIADMTRAFVDASTFPSGNPDGDARWRADEEASILREIGVEP